MFKQLRDRLKAAFAKPTTPNQATAAARVATAKPVDEKAAKVLADHAIRMAMPCTIEQVIDYQGQKTVKVCSKKLHHVGPCEFN